MLSRRKWKFDPSRIKDRAIKQTADDLLLVFSIVVLLPLVLGLGAVICIFWALAVVGVAVDFGYFFYSLYWLIRHVAFVGWTGQARLMLAGLFLEPLILIALIWTCRLGGTLFEKYQDQFWRD